MLTLYRRHRKNCEKGYAQNQRVYRPTTARARAKDCSCPINAEGKLQSEFLTNRSTHCTKWTEAEAIAEKWEKDGTTVAPEPVVEVTVEYAVASFLASMGPSGKNVEPSTYQGFTVLLERRLKPFCAERGILLITKFDSLDVTTKFVESWVNLSDPGPLSDSTKKTTLERFRAFLAYCLDRNWVETNHAKKIKYKFKTDAKYGMTPDQERKVFEAIRHDDLRAFCLVMRWAGLRISDATTLNHTQLVQRASGVGWAIKIDQTTKTRDNVYVPIPNEVAVALQNLPTQCEKDGKRYWFWSGECKTDTAKDNWYTKIMRVVHRVGLDLHVTPHTFRHTFSIQHLNAGVDIKQVSRWLSHASVTVTERHYSHAILNTLLASDMAFELSLQRQKTV